MSQNYFVAIMAGGIGSRFWPSSRSHLPKQFLDITGNGKSLLQQTVDRLDGLVQKENILVVSNQQYKDLILEQVPWMSESQLLLEPSRNNTAPCVAYTALHLNALNKQAVFAMIPADHVIEKEDVFRAKMRQGFEKATSEEAIVTLGIAPDRPDTGYGYIHYDQDDSAEIAKVFSFKEKPNLEMAKEYLNQGGYVWNAGIFIWSCQTILSAFANNSPMILNVLTEDQSKFGTSDEQEYVNRVYPSTESISVDYAILEHAQNVYTIPVDMGWSDLGTWNSLYAYSNKDNSGNAQLAATAELIESKGNLIRVSQKDKLIVVKGLEDFIIIDEDDVLLIYPREQEQEIKQVRLSIKDEKYK